jgi:predicted PurR-regulated permease PerM
VASTPVKKREHSTHLTLRVSHSFVWRLLALAAVIVFVWFAGETLVVAFAGILFAAVLRTFIGWARRLTRLNDHWAYLLVLLVIVGVAAAWIALLGPRIVNQGAEIGRVIPQSVHRAEQDLNRYEWGRYLTQAISRGVEHFDPAARLSTWADHIGSFFTDLVVIAAIGCFAAYDPKLYRDAFLLVLPTQRRKRAAELLDAIGRTLQWWLIGQFVPMLVLGIGTFVGLWWLQIPLAFTLALFTAVMLFIPYAGSVAAFVPAGLVALMQGPLQLFWVLVMYLIVHGCEGYLVTPLVQRRAVRLAPALTVFLQLLMWKLAGLLGLMVATPLGAASLVAFKKLYVDHPPSTREGGTKAGELTGEA